MGLLNQFGNAIGGLFGEGFADRAAMAGALLNGDYGAAATIKERQAAEKQLADKEAAAKAEFAHSYSYFKSLGMPDDQAYTLASDPSIAAGAAADRAKGRDYAASGGSHYDPVSGQWTMAPSRHEYQGSVFDVGGGVPGQQAPVTLQHEGVQIITPQPMTHPFGVSSFSGLPMGSANAQIPQQPTLTASSPVPVRTKAQRDALPPGTPYIAPNGTVKIKTGGPSPSGSGGFL